jgi:6-phosphofructokinase 2
MAAIATLTLNPTIDLSFEVDRIFPTHKMRGRNERHDPGGGGINVARVFVRLGGNARCYYLSGGATGAALDGLLDLHQLVRTRIPIRGETRISTSVFERESGQEYRFVTAGPTVSTDEWRACEALLAEATCDYLVASGSLPQGVPEDFYARVARTAAKRDARFVLDSSGAALAQGLAGGDVFLVKPSIGELRALTGQVLDDDEAIVEAAGAIVKRGEAKHVAVTMGGDGALLVNASGALRLAAIPVNAASTVGAGDSFLAAVVHALAGGREPAEACRLGMAAGAAAVLRPGTNLAQAEDIQRLYLEISAERFVA